MLEPLQTCTGSFGVLTCTLSRLSLDFCVSEERTKSHLSRSGTHFYGSALLLTPQKKIVGLSFVGLLVLFLFLNRGKIVFQPNG